MAISEADIKLLWGRAAGICSKPGCETDLTRIVEGKNNYNIGEMAHVIARSKEGPRGCDTAGSDTYDNLVLLCPSCHTDVDKAPDGLFPVELLHEWKRLHETRIREIGLERHFAEKADLNRAVRLLLAENYEVWRTLGPRSEVAGRSPASNSYRLWELRRVDKIIPNNRRIVNMVRANQKLLDEKQTVAFAEFANHAEAFEAHVYERCDSYPSFPKAFEEAFR